MKKMWIILFLFSFMLCFPLYPQVSGSITGFVLDEKTQKPLASVNIVIDKTVLGASSDKDGVFTIRRISPGVYTLNISMMGYRSKRIKNVSVQRGKTAHIKILLERTVIAINPVVVTAVKHSQSLNSSNQAVDVVTSSNILQKQSRSLEEAMFSLSGVYFNEENISIRGSSGYSVYNVGSCVLLMIDGVPVLTSDLRAINWGMIPLLDVDRVEIVKGAGSALYGSSAMGGVVNIITKRPSPRGHLEMRTFVGIYDHPYYKEWRWTDKTLHYEKADLAYSQQLGPLGFRISFSRSVSTGYMENNDSHQWNGTGKFVYTLPDHSCLDLYASWMQETRGGFIQWLNQNSPFEVPPFNKKDKISYKMMNFYLQYHLPISSRFGLRFRLSNLISTMGNQLTAYSPGAFRPGKGFGWEVQADWIPAVLHHLTFGNEFRRDISGSQYFGNHRGYSISPYIQDEWTIFPNLTSTFGVRLDRHVLIGEKPNIHISPKFGLNYIPFAGTVVRTSTGSGFRAATVFEKYIKADYSGFNVIPNPELKPERSWFWDIGLRQNFMKNGHVEFSLFRSDYWNMIEPVVNFLGTIQFQNYIRARISGIELSTESWWWHQRISLSGNLTLLDPNDIHRNETLPYRPKVSCSLRGIFRTGPVSFQAEYRYASRIEKVEINPLDPRVPLKLLYLRTQFKWKNFIFQLAVNNVLNYYYTQVERRMGEVRNVSVGMLMDFGD